MRARLVLHVQPRARRTGVVGRHGDAIKVRVQAPPVEDAANAELVRFLAEALGLPAGAVEIVSGRTGRRKIVEVRGLTGEAARARLLRERG